jgi:hypothetical protein
MPVPSVANVNIQQRAVIVRTLQVSEKGDTGLFELNIDTDGPADFYARITIADSPSIEAMQLNRKDVEPAWTTIRFVDSGTASVTVQYELWDEDGGLAGGDDHCDINPAVGKRDLVFTYMLGSRQCTGDVQGVHDSPGNATTSEGAKPDKDRARVRFYVTDRPLTAS